MELTTTFMALLEMFRPVFTAPSHSTFCLLMSGWILSVRHRYVADLIISSDSVGNGHFSDYHRFFSPGQMEHRRSMETSGSFTGGSVRGSRCGHSSGRR